MNFRFTQQFERKARKLIQKNPGLRQQLTKQFSLFAQNPHYSSLRLHKLQGKRSTHYAIWVRGNLRAVCVLVDGVYVFFDLVTHDQY